MPEGEQFGQNPCVVGINGFDGVEIMLNVGRGVQTLIADDDGRIVAAVLPIDAWYPGARVPSGVRVWGPGEWLQDAIDARRRRRAAPDETGGDGRL